MIPGGVPGAGVRPPAARTVGGAHRTVAGVPWDVALAVATLIVVGNVLVVAWSWRLAGPAVTVAAAWLVGALSAWLWEHR